MTSGAKPFLPAVLSSGNVELLGLGQGCLSLVRALVLRPASLGRAGFYISGSLPPTVKQNDVEATKAAPVMNSAKADPSATSVPVSASADDSEMKKVLEKCKRQQAEMNRLADENRQLKVRCADECLGRYQMLFLNVLYWTFHSAACARNQTNTVDHVV